MDPLTEAGGLLAFQSCVASLELPRTEGGAVEPLPEPEALGVRPFREGHSESLGLPGMKGELSVDPLLEGDADGVPRSSIRSLNQASSSNQGARWSL